MAFIVAAIRGNKSPAPAVITYRPCTARITNSADQTIPASTWTVVQFNTARWDSDGFWNASNPNRLTIPAGLDGVYSIGASFSLYMDYGLAFIVYAIRLNGANYLCYSRYYPGSPRTPYAGTISTVFPLAAGDYLEFMVYQYSGSGVTLYSVAPSSPELYLMRLVNG